MTTTNIMISSHAEIKLIIYKKWEIIFSLISFSFFNLKAGYCLNIIIQLKIKDNKFSSIVKYLNKPQTVWYTESGLLWISTISFIMDGWNE